MRTCFIYGFFGTIILLHLGEGTLKRGKVRYKSLKIYGLLLIMAKCCYSLFFTKGMRAMVNLHCIDTFLLGPKAPSLKMLLFFCFFVFLFLSRRAID